MKEVLYLKKILVVIGREVIIIFSSKKVWTKGIRQSRKKNYTPVQSPDFFLVKYNELFPYKY